MERGESFVKVTKNFEKNKLWAKNAAEVKAYFMGDEINKVCCQMRIQT